MNPQEPKPDDKKVFFLFVAFFALVLLLLLASSVFAFKYFGKSFGKLNLADIVKEGFDMDVSTDGSREDSNKSTSNVTSESTSGASTKTTDVNNTTSTGGTSSTTTPPATKTPPQQQTCYKYEIKSGEFKSNKCYVFQDYSNLLNYLDEYSDAKWDRDFSEDRMDIVCGSKDFFGESQCDEATEDKQEAEVRIVKYRDLINNIIAKGK